MAVFGMASVMFQPFCVWTLACRYGHFFGLDPQIWMTGLMGSALSNFREGLLVVSHKTSFTSKV